MVKNWIWTSNLRALAEELPRLAGYGFDESDWGALEAGTNSNDSEQGPWFSYPLGALEMRAALEPEAGEMARIEVSGLSQTEAPLVANMLGLMQTYYFEKHDKAAHR